ncbi:hypothetical protein MPSEU_000329700 [Mayamaea pseudoterrestris]|nr:hypothetical protein MPSEU_000329700 [Mayamaea pseudoterrestris]
MRPNVIYPSDGSGAETPRRVTAKQFEIFCKLDNQNHVNWAAVLRRAKSHPSDILLREDVHGDTPLHAAFRSGDPPVDVTLALQAASRLKNDSGATPLHIAASHRCSVEAMRALLECGANWKEASPCVDTNNVGRTPAHSACMSFRNLEMGAFMLLLDQTLKEGFISVDKGREHEPTLGFEDEDDYLNDSYTDFDVEKCEKVVRNVMTVRDSRGMTPLALLFGRYRQRVRRVITDIDASRAGNKDAPEHAALVSAMRVHRELGELWDKARRIVTRLTEARLEHEGTDAERYMPQATSPASDEEQKRAAEWAYEQHRGREPTEDDVLPVYVDVADRESSLSPVLNETVSVARQFRIVHSSVGLIGYGCPPEMIRLAISIHPHQVSEMDEDGNLPLHIAAKASSFLGRYNDVMSANAAAAVIATNFSDDASVVSETASFFSSITVSQTTNPFDKVIKMLLQHYPKAAETPQGETGQLPLIMAMKAGQRSWTDGIRTLLNAYPAALHRSKVIAPVLYPHVLALVTNSNEIDETKLERHPFLRDKQIRQDNHSRTTLFEFLQANPEWLTGEDGDEQS